MRAMTRRRKLTFVAGAAGIAVLIAGLGAAGAVGASRILSPGDESKAVIDDAAAQLGIEPAELSDALKQALKNQLEEAVDEGRLTEEQADKLKERIDANEYPFLGGPWKLGFGLRGPWHGGFGHKHEFALLATAASYLGMSEEELREELQHKTLAEIAREQSKTAAGLVQQLVAVQTKRIDEAVDDGRLTEEQATELKEGLDERMQAIVDGELRWRVDGPRHRFWPGSGSPRAPPPSLHGGPSA
jgi:polyhydroxyalkanoate synthesis regulator phasin